MKTPAARRARRVLAFAAAGLLFFLSGCVYFRLLELKKQLADFDRYFETDLRDGLKLTLKTPVLLDEDLAFFDLVPESRQRLGAAERFRFRWQKSPAVAGEDPAQFEITADFTFVDHKLQRIALPERLFAFLPKPMLVSMLRAFGKADVDRAKRSATARVSETGQKLAPLTQAELVAMLGAPETIQREDEKLLLKYRYRGVTPEQHSGRIDMVFTVDPASGQVRRIDGLLFKANLHLDLSDEKKPAT